MGLGTLPDDNDEDGEGAIFADINITPVTDLFLVLLIMFMVGSTVAAKQAEEKAKEEVRQELSSGLKIDLPEGQAKEVDPGQASLVVGIQVDGTIAVNGKLLGDPGDLRRALQAAFADNKETQVVIKAEKEALHGEVVRVMELAKQIGLRRVAIATKGGK